MSLFKCIFGEKTGIRDSYEKSAGCGILVEKEWECGIRTPPFQTLCEGRFNYAIFNKHKTLNSLRFQITKNLENASIPASVCVLSSDF